jgi:hypothetical protein
MNEQNQMSKEEALRIIENVAAAFVGNLKDHQAVQTALSVIKNELANAK